MTTAERAHHPYTALREYLREKFSGILSRGKWIEADIDDVQNGDYPLDKVNASAIMPQPKWHVRHSPKLRSVTFLMPKNSFIEPLKTTYNGQDTEILRLLGHHRLR